MGAVVILRFLIILYTMLLHLLHLTLQLLQWSWICLVSSGEINFYICEILTKFDAF